MSEELDEESRKKIAAFLPQALETAIDSYHAFSTFAMDQDAKKSPAKEFYDHHNACKVAIAHIELLLKLAKYAHLPDDNVLPDNEMRHLVTLIENAQEEYNEYQFRQGREDSSVETAE